jgi:hypothetical protein
VRRRWPRSAGSIISGTPHRKGTRTQRTLCVRLAGSQRARRATRRLCSAQARRNRGHCPAAERWLCQNKAKPVRRASPPAPQYGLRPLFRLVGLSVDTLRAKLHACRTNHRRMPRPSQGLRPSNTKAKIHPGKSHVTWVLVLS